MNASTLAIIAYAASGIAIYVALYRLFRRADFSISELNECWLKLGWLVVFWPLAAILSLLQYGHLTYQRNRKKEREISANSRDKFSRMTMDELLAEQRKVLDSFDQPEK